MYTSSPDTQYNTVEEKGKTYIYKLMIT